LTIQRDMQQFSNDKFSAPDNKMCTYIAGIHQTPNQLILRIHLSFL
jgi:hypothetical protein